MKERKENKKNITQKSLTIVGIVLCVLLVPILIANCTMIIKSMIHKDEVPSFFSLIPMIVKTDSMNPEFYSGDLIIVKKADSNEITENDIITFFDPKGNGSSTVTHRVVEVIDNGDGTVSFITKGDNNNTKDKDPVPEDKLIGKYIFPIKGMGEVALFMQSTPGLLICVLLPLILFIGYDIIRRKMYDKSHKEDTEALLLELETLKAEKERQSATMKEENPPIDTQAESQTETEMESDSFSKDDCFPTDESEEQ